MMSSWLGGLRGLWGRREAEPAEAEPAIPEEDVLPPRVYLPSRPELGPLMRSLHDAGVVAGDMGPNQSGSDTYWRLQSLVYLAAHNFGHPGLKYRYGRHIHGPYSLGLASDFYRFDSMRRSEPIKSDEWSGLDAFLELARRHRGLDWLAVAATLTFINEKMLAGEATCDADHNHSHRACLVELTYIDRRFFAREGIFRVYDSIKGTLPAGERRVTA